jgi:hypothetical protein
MFAIASMREEMANTVAASTNGSRSPAAAINQNLVLSCWHRSNHGHSRKQAKVKER